MSPAISILVVDDDPAVRKLLDLALPHYGFAVCLAAGGTEAIHLYRRQREGIGLVLLDVRMPGGPDGPQTLAALRGLNPQVCCCFMTGDAGLYSEDDLLALGAVHVFSKPFNLGTLGQQLREVATGTSRASSACGAFHGVEPTAGPVAPGRLPAPTPPPARGPAEVQPADAGG